MGFDAALRALPRGAAAQAHGLTLGLAQYGGAAPREAGARLGVRRLRCASLLKPLYAWAAWGTGPYARDEARWAADAEPAIRTSDNDATNRLWHGTGPSRLLAAIEERTGVRWATAGAEPGWFGGVEVTAAEVARAYGELFRAAGWGEPAASAITAWMRQVAPAQGLGLREPVAAATGAEMDGVAVKAGWFGGPDEIWMRTHAVLAATRRTGPQPETVVVAALTALPHTDDAAARAYREAIVTGGDVLSMHRTAAGPTLSALTIATLEDLGLTPSA